MATKVLILGHSFISRFYDFLRFNVRADVNLNLNLNPHSEQVFVRGYPGAKIDYIKERRLHMVGSLQPTVVFLQMGSNDLCQFADVKSAKLPLFVHDNNIFVLKLTLLIFVLSLELTYPTDISHLNPFAEKQLSAVSFQPYANVFL
jgi:hypothetical protein